MSPTASCSAASSLAVQCCQICRFMIAIDAGEQLAARSST
jgi:hypothetical protein